jgi:hypothetical protein
VMRNPAYSTETLLKAFILPLREFSPPNSLFKNKFITQVSHLYFAVTP